MMKDPRFGPNVFARRLVGGFHERALWLASARRWYAPVDGFVVQLLVFVHHRDGPGDRLFEALRLDAHLVQQLGEGAPELRAQEVHEAGADERLAEEGTKAILHGVELSRGLAGRRQEARRSVAGDEPVAEPFGSSLGQDVLRLVNAFDAVPGRPAFEAWIT